MGQHYIPRYYLKGFSNSFNQPHIWVYEKGSIEVFESNIKNIAQENNRWSQSTENLLNSQIEQPANKVLNKIKSRLSITDEEKEALSVYIVSMIQRVPAGFEAIKKLGPETLKTVIDNIKNDIENLVQENPSKKHILEQRLRELPSLKSKFENYFPPELWYRTLSPNALPKVIAILPAMTWIFIVSNNQAFLTSDNPVFFFKNWGLGNPQSEVTFPISSNIALWASWINSLDKTYSSRKNYNVIREINRRTVAAATRYVYYSTEEQWIINIVNKKTIKLHQFKTN